VKLVSSTSSRLQSAGAVAAILSRAALALRLERERRVQDGDPMTACHERLCRRDTGGTGADDDIRAAQLTIAS